MKRRRRKRSSKAANPPTPKISVDGEKAAGPSIVPDEAERQTPPRDEFIAAGEAETPASSSTVLAEADYIIDLHDELAAAVETETPAEPSVVLDEANRQTLPLDESVAAVETEKPAEPSIALAGADRRAHPRYEFTAAVEVIATESGARIKTRVRDLSQEGCYVDTDKPLPLGTVTDVHITKGAQLFEARGRVVYSRADKGMGLIFTAIEPEQRGTLGTWLAESRETSWLAANRRRSQRVLMAVPVRVSGQNVRGAPFEEDTHTRAISAHGTLILMVTQVHRGQRLTLSNVQTKAALECVVAHIDRGRGEQRQVGVEFTLPNPMFWHVAFPPKDWTPRHPHAKPHLKTGDSN
jgi:hypothetical protein